MRQTETVASNLHDHRIHDATLTPKAGFTENSWKELTEVFKAFGLTPTDMGIPWSSPQEKSSLSRTPSRRGVRTPLLPLERLKSSNSIRSIHSLASFDSHEQKASKLKTNKSSIKKKGNDDKKHPSRQLKNFPMVLSQDDRNKTSVVESKFKSYSPSSWRDEVIKKKAQENAQVS
jgi:hypothetical protein